MEATLLSVETHVDFIAEAIAARLRGTPDEEPTVRVRAAYRDLNCKGNGPECFRRVWYPGADSPEWPDCDRLPRRGELAGNRRSTVYCSLPIGTLVIDFERRISRYQGGKCDVKFALVHQAEKGDSALEWLSHRALRARHVWEVTLPDGSKIEVPRAEENR